METQEKENKFSHSMPSALQELCKLENSESTKELLKIIPEDRLSFWVCFMKLCPIKIAEFKKSLGYSHNFPKTEMKKINEVLTNLKKKEWLSDNGIKNIEESLKEQMAYSTRGRKYFASKALYEQSKTGGLPKDYSIAVLHYCTLCIIDFVKEKTGKNKYTLIANFLTEQGITDEEGISRNGIKNIHKKKNKDELVKFISANKSIEDLTYKLQFKEHLTKEEFQKVFTSLK